jgi:hypothetical protein
MQLDILVENMGRINYDPYICCKTPSASLKACTWTGRRNVIGQMFGLPFSRAPAPVAAASKQPVANTGPVVRTANKPAGTSLDLRT